MGVFLVMIGSIALTVGCVKFAMSALKQAFSMAISGYASNMIGPGIAEKAKILDKKPQMNDLGGGNKNSGETKNGGQLPDMRGVDSKNRAPMGGAESNVNVGGGASANLVVGAVVGVGMMQSYGKTRIKGGRLITGPMLMGNSQNKIYKPKKIKSINQTNSSNLNEIKKGKLKLNQGGNIRTAMGSSKVVMNVVGTSQNEIHGNIKNVSGEINAKQINGVSKAKSLLVDKLYATKKARIKVQNASSSKNTNINNSSISNENNTNQQNTLSGVPSSVMNIYNNNIQKVTAYSTNSGGIGAGLNTTELTKLAEVYRLQSNNNVSIVQGSNNYREIQKREDIYKEIIKTAPHLNPSQIIAVANRALKLNNDRSGGRQSMAAIMANSENNLGNQNMKALDNILMNNTSVAENFNNYVDENYKKDVEQRAKNNIEARKNMTLEEKEKEREAMAILAKKEILEDPDGAEYIIGKEGVILLKEALGVNASEHSTLYKAKLRELEAQADREYAELSGNTSSDSNSLREERIKNEIKQDVEKALQEMNEKVDSIDKNSKTSWQEAREKIEQNRKMMESTMNGDEPIRRNIIHYSRQSEKDAI